VGFAIGAVTNIASVSVPKFVKGHQAWAWLVLIGLGVLATWLSLREEKTDGWTRLKSTSSTLPAPHERTRALANVREFVTGRLNENVDGQPPLDLTVVPAPDALPGQTKSDFERDGAAVPGATVLEAYDNSSGSMALLGPAGAGKSTQQLRIAEYLLKRAEDLDGEPVPFVISLSGWGQRRAFMRHLEQKLRWRLRRSICWVLQRPRPQQSSEPPMDDLVRWLNREVYERYGASPGQTLAWLKNRRLVLLLDALDECAEEARDWFVTEFGRLVELVDPPVVLCCRTPDFEKLASPPALRSAWKVQPLTRSQVEQALPAEMKDALHEDGDLWKLLNAPIWLKVIKRLNRWPERVRDPTVSMVGRRRELLDAFLSEIFSTQRAPAGARSADMRRWVVQVAQLAGAAPDPDSVDLRALTREVRISSLALFPVVVRAVPVLLVLPFALAFVLPLAQLYGLASTGHMIAQAAAYLGLLTLAFVAGGLVPGYDAALVPTRRTRRRLIYGAVLTGTLSGLLGFGLVRGFHALAASSMDTVRWVLVGGFAFPVVLLLRCKTARLRGLAAGLAALSIASLFVPTMAPDEFTYGVAGALQGALLMLPVLAVFAARGLSFEGFRLSPAMLVVVPVTGGLGLAVCLIPWMVMWLTHGRSVIAEPLKTATIDGWLLAAACLTGLVFLLRARLTSWAGRLFLALAGGLPWQLRPLLADAESKGLFIKSGDGYRFAHQLIQQHLAEMDVLDLPPLTEPDPGLRRQALTRVGQVITDRRIAREPPARFPAPLSDGMDASKLAQKLAAPSPSGRVAIINGRPDSGRSTLLLDVAAELINQPNAPVPLVLPTSVWDAAAIRADRSRPGQAQELGQRTFTRLLLRAVDKEYGLPPQDTRQLLLHGEIILLLDDDRLTRREALRFLHLVVSFHGAYPKVGLALALDLASLPMAVQVGVSQLVFDSASTTRITPLQPGILTSAAYVGYVRPLAESGFSSKYNESLITTFGQLHRLVEAAGGALESQRPIEDVYLARALGLAPGEQWLRAAMQKIAWLSKPDRPPPEPPFIGIRTLRWTVRTPPPLARATARCTTPLAHGLILAIGAAYAIAPRFGTSTALLGSLILILLDLAWLGRPWRGGLGGDISLRQRCAALVLGAALGLALGWAAFGLQGPLVRFVAGWTTLERSLLLPVSAGTVIVLLSLSGSRLLKFRILAPLGLATATALYFAGPRAPEAFTEGFGAGFATGAAICFVLTLETQFTQAPGDADQSVRSLGARIALALSWYGAVCAAASWGHPGDLQFWPVTGLVLGYGSSAVLLFLLMFAPAGLIFGPPLWFLGALAGLFPWRLGPALRRARARGWILPGLTFYDPLVQSFLSAEAERAWSLPATQELFPHSRQFHPESE
jgi:hypothetical protein